MRTVAGRHSLAAYHNKHCRRPFRGYQHRWHWTLKIWGFSDLLCNFWLWRTFQEWIAV